MNEIKTITDYFKEYGAFHTRKATELLVPLHLPEKDPLPDFSGSLRQPYEPQQHVIAAIVKMLDEIHRGMFVGECGVGKTLCGMLAIHEHARRSSRQGGCNGNYRALVLCPDHLIGKWEQEIRATLPMVKVTTFDADRVGCKALVTEMIQLYGSLHRNNGHWRKPEGAQWYILGRDQAKLMPRREPLGSKRPGFDGQEHEHGSARVRKITVEDAYGKLQVMEFRLYLCPRCGRPAVGKNNTPINVPDSPKLLTCEGRYGREIVTDDRKPTGLIVRPTVYWHGNNFDLALKEVKPGNIIEKDDRKYLICKCNEPLWQYTAKPKRWAPAVFLSRKMPNLFRYLIIDEIHEQKSQTTAQANAAGKLISSSRYCLALTGTLIGGYAKDLFYLLMRTNARPLLEEGFGWESMMKFTREYGRIERIVTTKDGEVYNSARSRSLRKEGKAKEEERPAPGIMPALFGRHLLDKAIFLSLDDLAENLPPLREYVTGPLTDDHDLEDSKFWLDCRIEMELAQAAEYERLEKILIKACQDMLQNGSMKLLSALLVTTLEYPDRPWDWRAPTEKPEHLACGYWEQPRNKRPENWRGVVQPISLPQDVVYPKETALLRIVEREVAAGNQVWIYVQMTNKRDVQPRLKQLLEAQGYTVSILRSKAVAPRDRLDWIIKEGRKVNVIISHPQLVQTGIDFFNLENGGYSHNFNAIVFYQTGYSLFTLRQASRRAWRIGQQRRCRVYYLHYRQTMQQRALALMARKLVAAVALDGELNVEGLTAISEDSRSMAMQLARTISENINEDDLARNWTKLGGTKKPKIVTPAALVNLGQQEIEVCPIPGLDVLPMEAALVAQTLLDHGDKIGSQRLIAMYEEFFDLDPADLEALANYR